MNHFTCACGSVLFFENSECLQCHQPVGYEPGTNRVIRIPAQGAYRRCENGERHGVCNWLVPQSSRSTLCRSCQLTRTIPDLSIPGNLDAWKRLEAEKRRVLYTIAGLGLSPLAKTESPGGLAFDFLAPTLGQPILTGHMNGVITLSINEANDVYRENERLNLREPYRTLIGHFRHEIGHYYWDRFFLSRPDGDARLTEFRNLFGDERADYGAALARHYQQGPIANWANQFITAYASVHPWEDWAETWAHYLHIVDTVETSKAFGWSKEAVPIAFTPFTLPDLQAKPSKKSEDFLHTLNTWSKFSPALNEIGVSLGHRNLYPFVLNAQTARKLHFVHLAISASDSVQYNQKTAA